MAISPKFNESGISTSFPFTPLPLKLTVATESAGSSPTISNVPEYSLGSDGENPTLTSLLSSGDRRNG